VKSFIRHISYYLPEKTLSNADLIREFPHLVDEEIIKMTGVKSRHISAPGQIGSDLAFECAEKLFREHPVKKEEIDFFLFCTEGLDYKGPSSACILQHRIGLPKTCGAMDIPFGCTGFVYGLSAAKAFVESGQAKNVLLLTTDVPSKVIHPADHELRVIFGDAGAATLISASESDSTIGNFVFGTDGSGEKNLIVRYSGSREAATIEYLQKNSEVGGMPYGTMEMKGTEIFMFALKVVPKMVNELLAKENLNLDEIDLFVFHQANAYLLEILRKKLKIEKHKFIIDMENTGNTVSASIPIALKNAMDAGRAVKGMRIMICGFGIGYSWAGTILTL